MTCSDGARKFIRLGHIPLLFFIQIFFIILFAAFVRYDPDSAVYSKVVNETVNSKVRL